MNNLPPYPWQMQQWLNINSQIECNRLPHAVLLSGTQGIGKFAFAKALANILLCQKKSACGKCKSCQLVAAESNPDYKIIVPEEKSDVIKIDQIREVIEFFNFTAMQNSYKIVVIYPAEAMNHAAANALLKTLEEPPDHNNLLLLVSHQSSALLATIRSRCQQINCNMPSMQQAAEWLQQQVPEQSIERSRLLLALTLSEGAPLKALALINENKVADADRLLADLTALVTKQADPFKIASGWQTTQCGEFLTLFLIIMSQVMRLQFGAKASFELTNLALLMQTLAGKINYSRFFALIDFVNDQYRIIKHKINLNELMLLETIFYKWTEIKRV